MKMVDGKIKDAMELVCGDVAERTMGAARFDAERLIWDKVEDALNIPARKWTYCVDGSWMMLQ